MEGTRRRPWSDLQPELLSMIGCRLHTRMDVLRFRSVCSSFRSSIPTLRRDASRFPFRIPRSRRPDHFLSESTVYALETADGAASGRARWLLRLEESERGYIRILSLFSRRRMASLPRELPPVLDCLQFRIIEICREYTLEYDGRTGEGLEKVVVHPYCVRADQHQCLVYFIDVVGQLCYWKYGDENWSHLGGGYDDIVVYQGKVCVTDQFGSVSWIDSSFKLQKFSLSIDAGSCRCHRRHRKRLVISSGDLYAVDECIRHGGARHFRAYRLDRECWRWKEVRSLGNSAFFLGNGRSFAVPATEIDGCEGDCIYYVENASSYSSYFWEDVKAFSLTDRGHKDVDFWFISLMKRGAITLE
ncbi:putative F-box protein At5g60060 [Rhodamnia argentea]|uniref:F-box protein At5g60060 n=1 Tax=Rhodamnia argentea TaxID=178133 RepID=A0A8B8PM53_9MYRT|nr:putative F-box protein At5g60060 [Rhodamnia argentea]